MCGLCGASNKDRWSKEPDNRNASNTESPISRQAARVSPARATQPATAGALIEGNESWMLD
jgi:hypothetical protein